MFIEYIIQRASSRTIKVCPYSEITILYVLDSRDAEILEKKIFSVRQAVFQK